MQTESPLEDLIINLYSAKVIEFGSFTLRSSEESPIYIDLRRLVSYPNLLIKCANFMYQNIQEIKKTLGGDLLCGVPLGGIPFTIYLSTSTKIPAILLRKETKNHGKRNKIEGVFTEGQKCIVVEDVITTGTSAIDTQKDLLAHRLDPTAVVCFFTYLSPDDCKRNGFVPVINIYDVVKTLVRAGKLDRQTVSKLYTKYNFDIDFRDTILKEELFRLNIGKRLCENLRKTPICLSLDLTNGNDITTMIRNVGEHISILKIHSDIITDFDDKLIGQLQWWAKNCGFLLMEDRKFCDIGNTVKNQLRGPTKIAEWADLVTVHGIAGPGTIEAILQVRDDIGIVLVAEMSSKDNLIDKKYTENVIDLANKFPDNIVGFVAQNKLTLDPTQFTFTPGISLDLSNDNLGQQYSAPMAALKRGSDFLIVGRDIYSHPNPKKRIEEYLSLSIV